MSTIGQVTHIGDTIKTSTIFEDDLTVTNDSTPRCARFTDEQIKTFEQLEDLGFIKPSDKNKIIPGHQYMFESWSDATHLLWAALCEHLEIEMPPRKPNAPKGNVKIHLEIEES